MQTYKNHEGKEEILFLSETDKEVLIYMYSDVWITPELHQFKNEILQRLEETEE